MIDDSDFLIYFERAIVQDTALVPRTCFYLKNIEKMSEQERRELVSVMKSAISQIEP